MAEAKSCYFPARYVLAILGHLGICVAYTMRVNLSVGLVAMVNSTYVQQNSHAKLNPECARTGGNSTSDINVRLSILYLFKRLKTFHYYDYITII